MVDNMLERARELNAACTLRTLLGNGFPKDDESWTLECELYDEDKNHKALMRQIINNYPAKSRGISPDT